MSNPHPLTSSLLAAEYALLVIRGCLLAGWVRIILLEICCGNELMLAEFALLVLRVYYSARGEIGVLV
jgi:hypothetical protein